MKLFYKDFLKLGKVYLCVCLSYFIHFDVPVFVIKPKIERQWTNKYFRFWEGFIYPVWGSKPPWVYRYSTEKSNFTCSNKKFGKVFRKFQLQFTKIKIYSSSLIARIGRIRIVQRICFWLMLNMNHKVAQGLLTFCPVKL